MDLSTHYLGLKLRTPLVAAASPLSLTVDGVRRLEDAGASMVVLFSLFEEQLTLEREQLLRRMAEGAGGYAKAASFFPEQGRLQMGPEGYLEHIRKAKAAVSIPIVASLNGTPREAWTFYARLAQEAGADAIELNLYQLATRVDLPGSAVEARYMDTVRRVAESVDIPVAVKIAPFLTAPAHAINAFADAGASGAVLFNRFYVPDLDLETRLPVPKVTMSRPDEFMHSLRWIAMLEGKVPLDFAATGGVHRGEDALKLVMAGAKAVMLCSVLLEHGLTALGTMERSLRDWLDAHDHASLSEVAGSATQAHVHDRSGYERTQYLMSLESYARD